MRTGLASLLTVSATTRLLSPFAASNCSFSQRFQKAMPWIQPAEGSACRIPRIVGYLSQIFSSFLVLESLSQFISTMAWWVRESALGDAMGMVLEFLWMVTFRK